MPVTHVLILGAGPAGLSAALAISQLPSSPTIRVTILEVRPATGGAGALGGAVNMTPLGLRYLDRLGVGGRVRSMGIPVGGVDSVALRTGRFLGSMWKGVDGLRVMRSWVVGCMREAVREKGVEIRYEIRVVGVREEATGDEGSVVVELEGGDEVRGDVLLGCDGLHSAARRLYVEPKRKEVYSGRVVAYGFAKIEEPGKTGVLRSDGKPAVTDTAMFVGRYGALVATFFEPKREKVFFAGVMNMEDQSGGEEGSDGWKTKGSDKAYVEAEVRRRFGNSQLGGVAELLERVDDWTLYPVYMLPPQGRWARGRVLLLGDAAHTMPPIGESIGLSIEDGVLFAHVLTRHRERTVSQLFDDYEQLRRGTIDKLYKRMNFRWKTVLKGDLGWIGTIFMELLTVVYLWVVARRQNDYFATDVAKMELPA